MKPTNLFLLIVGAVILALIVTRRRDSATEQPLPINGLDDTPAAAVPTTPTPLPEKPPEGPVIALPPHHEDEP